MDDFVKAPNNGLRLLLTLLKNLQALSSNPAATTPRAAAKGTLRMDEYKKNMVRIHGQIHEYRYPNNTLTIHGIFTCIVTLILTADYILTATQILTIHRNVTCIASPNPKGGPNPSSNSSPNPSLNITSVNVALTRTHAVALTQTHNLALSIALHLPFPCH